MNKDSLNLRLVGYPDFFNELNGDSFDLNYYFWFFIFSDDVLKLKILKNLSVNDKNNLIFIFKNIKLTYNIFLLLSKKDLQVYHIFFAYHIINELLNILNKYLKYEKIKFYGNIEYSDNILNNIEDSFFYKFLDFNKIKFLDFNSDIVFKVNIKFSSQFYQLKILQYFYVKNNKKIYFSIDISNILEFENKLSYKKILIENIDNILDIKFSNLKSLSVNDSLSSINKFLGYKNLNYYIFNKGCYYRKCSFCNIGKFGLLVQENHDNVINDIIIANKSGLLDTLHIGDPDIQASEIKYICNKFIQNNVDIKIHIRTRYSKDYDIETLNTLYKGGFRFMGVGLENCSTRLNKLMNKSDLTYSMDDFSNFIINCYSSGINIHLYTIFGFPTETIEDINLTNNFLLSNLNNFPFFTYTAGLFGLSKGTYVYENPDKFNLTILKNNNLIDTFIQSWSEENVDKNSEYLHKILFKLQNSLFFPSSYNPGNGFSINNSFWYFIENSRLFHIYKMYYNENPFLYFWNINNSITKNDFLHNKYTIINYYQVITHNSEIYIKNWLNLSTIKADLTFTYFLNNYNNTITLESNLLLYKNIDIDLLYEFIKLNFFILNKDS